MQSSSKYMIGNSSKQTILTGQGDYELMLNGLQFVKTRVNTYDKR